MRLSHQQRQGPLATTRGKIGAVLIAVGEGLLILRFRSISDYYFPFVWLGFILLLDSALYGYARRSLFASLPKVFLALFPISVAFWWLFEALNLSVHNWIYIGAQSYQGVGFVVFASIDFSTVLPAVWVAALLVHELLPGDADRARAPRSVPKAILLLLFTAGIFSIILPPLYPRYAFPLLWICLYFLLDPVNEWLGRPSIIGSLWSGSWRLVASFALGTLLCGFFWEAWNYWAMPKWEYNIPFVNFWHVFEMPLLGYGGYLPFGLELFAMTNFVLPFLGLGTLTIDRVLGIHPEFGDPYSEERVS